MLPRTAPRADPSSIVDITLRVMILCRIDVYSNEQLIALCLLDIAGMSDHLGLHEQISHKNRMLARCG
jgi:hypothetical protein